MLILHGTLNKEAYMELPKWVKSTNPNQVYRLKHSIYGLKQYFGSSFTTLLIHVDDLFLIGNNFGEIQTIKQSLDNIFHIKDLGILKYSIDFEVSRSKVGISLSQRKYTLDILFDIRCLTSKPISTLMANNNKLHATNGEPFDDPVSYYKLIGQLLYLTTTKLDIGFVVHNLVSLCYPIICHYQDVIVLEIRPTALKLKDLLLDIEKCQSKLFYLLLTFSYDQLANILTKSLNHLPFSHLLSKLRVLNIYYLVYD
ncbi:hypothetical protein CR513_46200, partial [Mucuna pruriens]